MFGKKRKPSGYIAICQCGSTIGAIDLNQTESRSSGKILGRWVSDGCDLKAQFGTWSAVITPCQCDDTN